jgi:hypothetical protein
MYGSFRWLSFRAISLGFTSPSTSSAIIGHALGCCQDPPVNWSALRSFRRARIISWFTVHSALHRRARIIYRFTIRFKGRTLSWCFLCELETPAPITSGSSPLKLKTQCELGLNMHRSNVSIEILSPSSSSRSVGLGLKQGSDYLSIDGAIVRSSIGARAQFGIIFSSQR